jgi:hypothetical protein
MVAMARITHPLTGNPLFLWRALGQRIALSVPKGLSLPRFDGQ